MDCLRDRLQSRDLSIRRQAAEELLQNGTPARGVAPIALQALADPDEVVREGVNGWLEDCGPPGAEDVVRLIPLLSAGHADIAYWAATLLGRLGPEAATAIPQLIHSLRDENPLPFRERAAWALGKIGRAARGAIPQLEILTKCDSPRLARLAEESMREIAS